MSMKHRLERLNLHADAELLLPRLCTKGYAYAPGCRLPI